MPARRRKKNQTVKRNFDKKKLVISLFVGLFFIVLFIVVRLSWDRSEDYFTVASVENNGDIKVEYVDLAQEQVYSVTIPKDTEVNLAMQRGILRAHSVGKLLQSEKLPGQFLPDTIMKTFHFPVDYWQIGTSTDLPLMLALRFRIMKVRGTSVEQIDLSETNYLISEKLADGEEGYIVRDTMPILLQSIFADPAFSQDYLAIQIVNRTGEYQYYLHNFIKVLEVMGVKVAPITDEEKENSDCTARSLNKKALERIASIFNCKTELAEPSSFDLEIIVGDKFFKRF